MRKLISDLIEACIYRRELTRHYGAGVISLRVYLHALGNTPKFVTTRAGELLWVMGEHAVREEMEWRYLQYLQAGINED